MTKIKHLAFLGIILFVVMSASAENYTGDFLTNGIGARALGLGGAYVSIADDATATYWNPAGIAGIDQKYQVSLMHAARRSGLGSFSNVSGISKIIPHLTIGLSWISAGIDDIPIYYDVPAFDINISAEQRKNDPKFRPREQDFIPAGYLNDSENAYVLSLASGFTISQSWWDNFGRDSIPPEFLFGINTKVIFQSFNGVGELDETTSQFANYGSSGYGFDAGMLVRLPDLNAIFGLENVGGFAFGFNLQDISQTTLTWNTVPAQKESIPSNTNIGLTYFTNLLFNRELIVSYQWQARYGGQTHLGIEYELTPQLALRTGLRDSRFTSGIGIQLKQFRLDYALLIGDLINTHFLSVLWAF
ncbi:MAG: hypothetical protein OXD54_17320 [Candidatus Poribacteria bacterium]|nr:hypothetical protein [Candidatus Poribacteria bacterium]